MMLNTNFLRVCKYLLVTWFASYGTLVMAQLFPGLSGEELAQAIRDNYTPSVLLNEGQARDTLYARVFRTADSVRCIYSGLARYLPDGVDPSQHLYGTGQETGSINLEHGWPQSKGAGKGTDGNTNMFHLFPSRAAINSDRADFPFQDIPDAQTMRWYYKDVEMSSKPSQQPDAYSEFASGRFEPRESVKGDIARAMFYFWTIYRADAEAADPSFFSTQLDHLCQWHADDPVDDEEMRRHDIITGYQDQKGNPFITDCSLVMRAYCPSLAECLPVSVDPVSASAKFIYDAGNQVFILIREQLPLSDWQLMIYDVAGRVWVHTEVHEKYAEGASGLPPGYYFAVALFPGGSQTLGFIAR